MKEKWIEHAKKVDFQLWSQELGISKLAVRLLINRGIQSIEEAKVFLDGTMEQLSDPHLMKDLDKGVELLYEGIRKQRKIAICTDFDDDGIFSGETLYEGIRRVGGEGVLFTPDRIQEGYGLNRRIIDEAKAKGCEILLTCDNGIAALSEIEYAKELGFTVIVTDHHEVQYEEKNGERSYLYPKADAVIDPKQKACPYPFKELCGTGIAFRLIQCLYEKAGIPKEEEKEFYEYVAIATVADVVELKGENRILVKTGLQALRKSQKISMNALFEACGLKKEMIDAYHLGFVIGPCFNAVGRLQNVKPAFDLLQSENFLEALKIANEIRSLNEERKSETEKGIEFALTKIREQHLEQDKVLLLRISDVHESVIGIVAGKMKEKLNHPVFVFTECVGEEGYLKASGRSIKGYSMIDALIREKDLLERFGGHEMAAGLTIKAENFENLRKSMNAHCALTEEEFIPKIYIDAQLPLNYISEALLGEIDRIAPFGMGNTKPVFARKHFRILKMQKIGKQSQFLKMIVSDESGIKMEALYFGDQEEFEREILKYYSKEELKKAYFGNENQIDMAFLYAPSVNEFRGVRTLQITIQSYCKIE